MKVITDDNNIMVYHHITNKIQDVKQSIEELEYCAKTKYDFTRLHKLNKKLRKLKAKLNRLNHGKVFYNSKKRLKSIRGQYNIYLDIIKS